MPKITVNAYAALGDILGSRNVEVSTSAKTIGELIDFLAEKYGASFKEMLVVPQTNVLQSRYKIIVNGRDIDSLDSLKTRIRDGDKIHFFPPVAGG